MCIIAAGAATTDWIIAIATALGAPVAAVGVIVAAIQLRGQRRATEAQLVLALDEQFEAHKKTHRRFRPGGSDTPDDIGRWSGPNAEGPATAQDWADVEAYMGLFERISRMVDDGLIKPRTLSGALRLPRSQHPEQPARCSGKVC